MNRGVPPTALNARTGEFTPPGVTARARSNRAADSGGADSGIWGTSAFSPVAAADHEPGPRGRAVRRMTSSFGHTGHTGHTGLPRLLRSPVWRTSYRPTGLLARNPSRWGLVGWFDEGVSGYVSLRLGAVRHATEGESD